MRALIVGRSSYSAGGRKVAAARDKIDRVKIKFPLSGDIWVKYQVAQLSRMLSTLLTGGIPLVQAWKPPPIRWVRRCCRKRVDTAGKNRARGPAAFRLA